MIVLRLIFSLLLLFGSPLPAAGDIQTLWEEYRRGAAGVQAGPLSVRYREELERLSAEVFGVLPQPFATVADALSRPGNWCEFVPLSFNIKACVWQSGNGRLVFYAGRKFYQPPEKAFPLDYRFRVESRSPSRLRIVLKAEEGPMGTRDYLLVLEGMPVSGGTFLRLHSSYRPSLASRIATRGYLSTLARDKVGFTVAGTEDGRPVYVGGEQGIVERNAVRYFLALQVFLETLPLPPKERFLARLNRWFELTERYPEQLHEMPRREYVETKRRERAQQVKLQAGGG